MFLVPCYTNASYQPLEGKLQIINEQILVDVSILIDFKRFDFGGFKYT